MSEWGDWGSSTPASAPAPGSGSSSGGGTKSDSWGDWNSAPAPGPAAAPAAGDGQTTTISQREKSQRARMRQTGELPMKDYSDMDKRRLRRLHRAVHLQDRFLTAAHDQGAALQKNARAVVLSCDHLRAGHDLWSGRLRQLKKRVESLEKQADWSSRHTDATITKIRQQLGDAAAYASGAPPTAVVSRPHPAVSTFYQATKRRVAALDEQMEELQAALGGAVSLTSKTGAGGAAHWRNPSVAVKQALQNEHSAIRRMAGGPIQAFRGRLDEVKERFTRMWREREQEDLAREQRLQGVDAAGSLSSGSSGGVPLHRRDPFIEADRKYEAATQLRALEQQSRLDHGEGAFGATDSELENVRRAVVAAREKAGQTGAGAGATGGTGGGWGSGDSGWGTSGGGSSSSSSGSGWGTSGGGSDWGASSGSGGGWGTSGGDSGWGTSAPAPSNNDPMSRPQGSLRRSTTRPQMRRQRAGGM